MNGALRSVASHVTAAAESTTVTITKDAALLAPGMLTQGARGAHRTPWHPVDDPLDPL